MLVLTLFKWKVIEIIVKQKIIWKSLVWFGIGGGGGGIAQLGGLLLRFKSFRLGHEQYD